MYACAKLDILLLVSTLPFGLVLHIIYAQTMPQFSIVFSCGAICLGVCSLQSVFVSQPARAVFVECCTEWCDTFRM